MYPTRKISCGLFQDFYRKLTSIALLITSATGYSIREMFQYENPTKRNRSIEFFVAILRHNTQGSSASDSYFIQSHLVNFNQGANSPEF